MNGFTDKENAALRAVAEEYNSSDNSYKKSEPRIKPQRKVVQIASHERYTVALCDDGTMWYLIGRVWEQIEPIPQDKIRQPGEGNDN
jgi:hypothetical protein